MKETILTESQHVEFKRELTEKLEQTVISFLNSKDGGIIYFGVDDDGTFHGLQNADLVQRQIADRIKNNIRGETLGLFDIVLEKTEGKNIVKLIISSGTEKPYYLKEKGMTSEGCFIRNGSRIEQMTNSIDGMSQEELVTGCSRPRNREIMRIFKDVELVEQLGSGMNRMMKAYSPDIFTITPNFFHTVFKYKSLEDTKDEPKENLPKEVPQVAQRLPKEVPQVAQRTFDFIKFQPKSTLAEMSRELGISERSIKNHIAVLKKEGFIERVGGKTYGYWKILGGDEDER